MIAPWPEYRADWDFAQVENRIERMKEAVRAIRNVRASMNVPPSKKADIFVVAEKEEVREAFTTSRAFFTALSNAASVTIQADKTGIGEDAVSAVTADAVMYIPLAELVDIEKEIARLTKEEKRLAGELKRSHGMLGNERFISKAPAEKIAEEREKLEKYTQMMEQVKEQLARLQKA